MYTSAKANSATWDSVYTSTKAKSANWDAAYTYASTYPLIVTAKVTGINLGGATTYTTAYTVPTGKIFVATGLTVVFDSGTFTNITPGAIRLTRGSIVNPTNKIMNDLNIGATTYAANTLLRRSSINDNNATGQSGDIIQIVQNPPTTAYTATVIIEGVLY